MKPFTFNSSCIARLLLLIFTWCLLSGEVSAQETGVPIVGRVLDATNGETLPGVNVAIKNKSKGGITNFDGKFSILAEPEDVIVFSYVGFISQELKVGSRTEFSVSLTPDMQSLEEVVVIGYGTQEAKDLTGAVGLVKAEELNQYPVSNVSQAMQGRMAGVQVSNSTSPGGGIKVRIRGVGTITGASDPLYVVDGVQMTSLNNIDVNDIESMNVLKDASAAAIYGTRAANGVVIITTKSGKSGRTQFNFNAEYGMQYPLNQYEMMNTQQYKQFAETLFTTGEVVTIKFNKWVYNEDYTETTNWMEEVFRPAPVQRYNFSGAGGSEAGSYRLSASYFNQEGLQRNTGYERFNLSLNSNMKKGIFNFGESINLYTSMRQVPGENAGPAVMKTIPHMPVYDPTTLNGYGIPSTELAGIVNTMNPVLNMDLKQKETNQFGFNGNIFGELELLTGLKFRSSLNAQMLHSLTTTQHPKIDQGTATYATVESFYGEDQMRFQSFNIENYFNYDREFGGHKVGAMLGTTALTEKSKGVFAGAFENRDGIQSVVGNRGNYGNFLFEKHMLSFLGRVTYSYKDKYLMTGSLRRDGSSILSAANRWGNFPSFSLGWRVSEEPFLKGSKLISNMKIRGGYGELGRDLSLGSQITPLMYPFVVYPFASGTSTVGSVVDSAPSDNLRWETAKQTNMGVDLGLLHDKVEVVADYFIKDSEDALLEVQYMADYGIGIDRSPQYIGTGNINVGSIRNKGIELAVSYNNMEHAFQYRVSGNFTYLQNQVTKVYEIGGQAVPIVNGAQRVLAGEEMWHFYGYQSLGLFQSQDEIDSYGSTDANGEFKPYQPYAKPGDVKFAETNNDGVLDNNDRIVLGNSLPKYYFGLSLNANYKGFDLSLLLEGKSGFQVYNQNLRELTQTNDKLNRHISLVDNTWTEENPNADHPVINASARSFDFSDRMLQDGTYITAKNFQLGYNFSENLLMNGAISKLRLYFSVTNAFILSNYNGYNPDVWDQGSSNGAGIEYSNLARPTPRTVSAGVQMNF
ncbi:TonB-dependent receptor [Limibacter armeniacum]|uniref:SusC/RagA family TonB-linked outer membrane protein n=1 Tax=Limibacter armeniacum TaxID=466084 RepID=UPI002FE693F3